MKAPVIRFFSSAENSPVESKTKNTVKAAKVVLTGYVSSTGKLVFPAKTVENLELDLGITFFKVGIDQGKRTAKSLYLVPSTGEEETFSFKKAAKSYTLALPFILRKSRIDFAKAKFVFTIRIFEYEGQTAFELQLSHEEATVKKPYTGKPRGRKPIQK